MDFEAKLEELFIDLPEPAAEVGNVAGAAVVGKSLHVAGALPFQSGRLQYPGRVGIEVKLDNAKLAARAAAVMALALARAALGGSIDRIRRVVRVDGSVACGAEFKDHEKVLDGASELFGQVFGKHGRHVRSCIGAASLPRNSCVSLSVEFELK
jgi:enamine deaminase RidA (YjgF/YER057c/UK114 family)